MRALYCGLGLLLLVSPAAAQQFGPALGSPLVLPKASVSSAPSFMAQSMAKPNYLAFMTRPTFPSPLRMSSMMPTFPSLQNTMLLRNIFSLPQTQVTPPPKK